MFAALKRLWKYLTARPQQHPIEGNGQAPSGSALPGSAEDVYLPSERLLYRYFTGQEIVPADPMQLWQKLMEVGPELSIDMKVANSALKDAPKAHEAMLKKVRSIFSVKPWEEGGLSQLETIELLNHFLSWCHIEKKNTSPLPTSAAATSAPSAPSSVASPATESSSPSGSAGAEISTSAPTSSPSGPA